MAGMHALPFAAIVAFALPIAIGSQRGPALPKEVSAVCDAIPGVVGKTPGIKQRRRTGSFGDETLRAPIASCRIEIDGSMKQLGKESLPTEVLEEYFWAQKWTELADFSADGPDGTSFAYRRNGAACLVRAQWDGGSDDEPDSQRADRYTVIALCGNAADFVRPQ